MKTDLFQSCGHSWVFQICGKHPKNTQKRCPFHYRGLECKSRKSRNTWNNRQIWPWSTEWSKAKSNRVLPREPTGYSKHPLQQHKRSLHMNITKWSTLKSTDYICSKRWRSSIQSTKTRPGADCGSHHELLIIKFRLKLKKVRKTARPFSYDLNKIPYDYTVEVRNRFNGKHPLPQHKRRLYTWTSPDGQHQNQIDYILCCQRWRSSI